MTRRIESQLKASGAGSPGSKRIPRTALPGGTAPSKIKIKRESGFHTYHIGKRPDGTQFMAFVVGVPSKKQPSTKRGKLKWYAVVHRFNADGTHLRTEASFLGAKEFASRLGDPETDLIRMVKRLGRIRYGDIKVKLFSVRVEGIVFGLVDSSVPEDNYQRIDLIPNGLAFFPPWNGDYET